MLVQPINQEPPQFSDQVSPYELHNKQLTLFAYSSTSYRDPQLHIRHQKVDDDSDNNDDGDPDIIYFQSVNNH